MNSMWNGSIYNFHKNFWSLEVFDYLIIDHNLKLKNNFSLYLSPVNVRGFAEFFQVFKFLVNFSLSPQYTGSCISGVMFDNSIKETDRKIIFYNITLLVKLDKIKKLAVIWDVQYFLASIYFIFQMTTCYFYPFLAFYMKIFFNIPHL